MPLWAFEIRRPDRSDRGSEGVRGGCVDGDETGTRPPRNHPCRSPRNDLCRPPACTPAAAAIERNPLSGVDSRSVREEADAECEIDVKRSFSLSSHVHGLRVKPWPRRLYLLGSWHFTRVKP